MEDFNMEELSTFLPNNIKLEIIKTEFLNAYNLELGTFNLFSLCEQYKKIQLLLKYFNLPDEVIVNLYIWSKHEREKMGLSDNLYNISEYLISRDYKYKNVNEKINSKQKL